MVPYHATGAAAELKYEVIVDGVTFGNDMILTGLRQCIFHQQTASALDTESFGLDFPGALAFSPSQGTNIALPSISQTVDQSETVSTTGFFFANYPYASFENNGAPAVGVGTYRRPSPVTPARFRSNALMYPEMVNKGILKQNLSFDFKNLNSTEVSLPPITAPGAYGQASTVLNNTTGMNMTPLVLSSQRFNLDSNSTRIDSLSIVERMWRNSHIAHLMDNAFEGPVSRPVWIAPIVDRTGPYLVSNLSATLQYSDHFKVLGEALDMTRPGKTIRPGFWELLALGR
jgi:hypothetical protein